MKQRQYNDYYVFAQNNWQTKMRLDKFPNLLAFMLKKAKQFPSTEFLRFSNDKNLLSEELFIGFLKELQFKPDAKEIKVEMGRSTYFFSTYERLSDREKESLHEHDAKLAEIPIEEPDLPVAAVITRYRQIKDIHWLKTPAGTVWIDFTKTSEGRYIQPLSPILRETPFGVNIDLMEEGEFEYLFQEEKFDPYREERNWHDDFADENGNYMIICAVCGEEFTGHKRRFTCKLCGSPKKESECRFCFWEESGRCYKEPVTRMPDPSSIGGSISTKLADKRCEHFQFG